MFIDLIDSGQCLVAERTQFKKPRRVSEATFYNWKKKFGSMGVTELRRLRQLEEENHRLKRLVADLSLDKEMLQDVIRKKF